MQPPERFGTGLHLELGLAPLPGPSGLGFDSPLRAGAIEEFLSANPNPNLHFIWVTPPEWLDTRKPDDPKSSVGLRHYVLWQRAALRKAEDIHERVGFDIAHHVSWGTVILPPPLHRLPVPFVWGPLGGGQVTPRAFRSYLGPAWRKDLARALVLSLGVWRPAFLKAARKSKLALATNHETAAMLKRAGAPEVTTFLDSGIRTDFLPPRPYKRGRVKELTFLWVGKFEARKCLPLALEAMAQVKDLPCRLLLAGTGSLRQPWEALAEQLGLSDRVEFLGQVTYNEMPALYRSADVFLFTSLRNSFGSQVLEAMAAGLPIVTLNHQGAGAFVPPEAGVKVPVTNPEETVSAFAEGLRLVANSYKQRARMGRVAWEFARSQTWEHRAQRMSQLYERVIQAN